VRDKDAGQTSRSFTVEVTVPPELEEATLAEWRRAYTHAGFSENEVRLWIGAADPGDTNIPGAQYFHPYQDIKGSAHGLTGSAHGLTDPQLEEAEAEEVAGLHRVIVYPQFVLRHDLPESVRIAALGAMLRHELEHARQQAEVGNDFGDMDRGVADEVGPNPDVDVLRGALQARLAALPFEDDLAA
jgi:hypothetical protein